ncbi:esterase/lipase family protein [Corynebacterium macginleyi]|uniref:esterase/lipase family protein n=1 Tax=Corynebacterium macginleyi TaxID=38290 RepID=UPI001F299AC8|nr:alpha/beta fold hydrolase [Corynebacterium macginleyi]
MRRSILRTTAAFFAAVGLTASAATISTANAAPSSKPAPAASESPVLPWTDMGPHGPYAKDIITGMAKQGLTENLTPPSANIACTPAPGENPVVLLHGMNSNAYQTYAGMSSKLAELGKCVYAFNVGKMPGTLTPDGSSLIGSVPITRAMAPFETSLAQFTDYINRLKEQTGATEVDLVGHSAGATIATAYAKQEQGHGVGTIVSIAGVLHGTSLLGISYALEKLNALHGFGDNLISLTVSPSTRQLLQHSDYMAQLNEGGIEVPGVRYASISTRFDEAVTPLAASQFTSPEATNHVLQDGCSLDASEHLGITYSPRAIALTANELGRNVEVPCTPVTGFVDGGSSMGADWLPSMDTIVNPIAEGSSKF